MSEQISPEVVPPQLIVYAGQTAPAVLADVTKASVLAPAVGATVSLTVTDTTRYRIGMYLMLVGLGTVKVESLLNRVTLLVSPDRITEGVLIPAGTIIQSSAPASWTGGAWMESGWTDEVALEDGVPEEVTISFSEFAESPVVMATLKYSEDPGTIESMAPIEVAVHTVTTSYAVLRVFVKGVPSAASVRLNWVAIGRR